MKIGDKVKIHRYIYQLKDKEKPWYGFIEDMQKGLIHTRLSHKQTIFYLYPWEVEPIDREFKDRPIKAEARYMIGEKIKVDGMECYVARGEMSFIEDIYLFQYCTCKQCGTDLISWSKNATCPFCNRDCYLT